MQSRWSAVGALGVAAVLSACTDDAKSPLSPTVEPDAGILTSLAATEEIYLIDNYQLTNEGNDNNGSIVFTVDLSDGATAQLATLVDLAGACVDVGEDVDCSVKFDQAHLGATPDGERVYAVNRRGVDGVNPVGFYERSTGLFHYVGAIAGLPSDGTVLAAISPDGELYMANQDSNTLYRIDPSSLEITWQWTIIDASTGTRLDLLGADIAFGADGTLYLWTNSGGKGLYIVDLAVDPLGTGNSALGTRLNSATFPFVTGLAIRGAGTGDLVGSSSQTDALYVVNRTTGELGPQLPLIFGGSAFDHSAGDMTTGMLRVPEGSQGCTPGYWRQTQHFDSWIGYSPDDQFSDVFADAFPGMTLLEVVKQGGGQLKALGRHTVAALLNSASSGVSYGPTELQIITAFNAAYASGDYEGLKNELEQLNERGCPLN